MGFLCAMREPYSIDLSSRSRDAQHGHSVCRDRPPGRFQLELKLEVDRAGHIRSGGSWRRASGRDARRRPCERPAAGPPVPYSRTEGAWRLRSAGRGIGHGRGRRRRVGIRATAARSAPAATERFPEGAPPLPAAMPARVPLRLPEWESHGRRPESPGRGAASHGVGPRLGAAGISAAGAGGGPNGGTASGALGCDSVASGTGAGGGGTAASDVCRIAGGPRSTTCPRSESGVPQRRRRTPSIPRIGRRRIVLTLLVPPGARSATCPLVSDRSVMPDATVATGARCEICDCRNFADRGSAADFNACGNRTVSQGLPSN